MKNKNYTPSATALFALLAFAACSPKSQEPTAATDSNPLESIRILDTKPVDARTVKVAKEDLRAGDEAVVFGQIGGVETPFIDGYAGFVLADTDLVFCNEMGDDDHCPMPWDACCEDPDKLQASRLSVQFVDAEGLPIEEDIKGYAKLRELSEVVVVGTVASASTADNLIIEATGVYVGNE